MPAVKTKIIAQGIGRRKTAIASVRLLPGTGKFTVNNRPGDEYFSPTVFHSGFQKPLALLKITKYDVSVKVHGGGIPGQMDALIMGLSRALASLKPEYHSTLSTNGFLTRDSRERQRRQVGMGGKSRRKKQSPKR
jgi:small subunit ribosomal protein S9